MEKMLRISYVLISIHLLFCISFAQSLSGRVQNADGQPVADAVVQPSGMLFSTKTGDDGSFLLDDSRMTYFWDLYERNVLFIQAKDYNVSVVLLEAGQREVEVILHPVTVENPEVPVCTAQVPKGFNTGGNFVRVMFSKKMKIKNDSNFEYSGFTITAKEKADKATLNSWVGVYSTTYPPTRLILESKNIGVVKNGIGLDWQGQTNDGTYWRYIGGGIGMIDSFSYETTSQILARQLDQVLVTMCINAKKP